MRSRLSFLIFVLFVTNLKSQTVNETISTQRVKDIITYLASDELRGRVNYTKEQLIAAEFLSNEFLSYGLETFPGFTKFTQPFRTTTGNWSDVQQLEWNGKKINDSLYYFFSHSLAIKPMNRDDFLILQVYPPLADSILLYNWRQNENILIWVNLPDSLSFSEAVKNIMLPAGVPKSAILLTGITEGPSSLKLSPDKNLVNSLLYNIVGVLPGKSRPDEAIIFSAHYDHVDHGTYGEVVAGIYNGANDDASGTTAVLELARYFAMRNDNERTLIFCLFAGEELGMYGSKAFVNLIKPESIKAVINIEMIGSYSAAGKNSFFVTGSQHSDLYAILSGNLKGEIVKARRLNADPALLFRRSDNFTFVLEGIPAHSIMCSDDTDPCYHQPCDDVKNIDIDNMTRIIKAIAISCRTLINGTDTPTRIKQW